MSHSSPDTETPTNSRPLLSVRDLKTYFRVEGGLAKAVDGVSFDVFGEEVLGIVGESGSGKSVSCLSIMRLIPDPPGLIAGGELIYRGGEFGEKSGDDFDATTGGTDLLKLTYPEMWSVRGNEIAMIFQEPMTALNPVFTIGFQIKETIRAHHRKMPAGEVRDRSIEMLKKVGIPAPARRMKEYPHQFSGGMRQRAMIAMALACHPKLLIADEPTTALDVTTQAQILDLMLELEAEREGGSIILVTHDLAVVAETCRRVIVMYGGKVQEVGTVEQIFYEPKHPYTIGLLESLPSAQERKHRLNAIPGNVPNIMNLPSGCKFNNRCSHAFDRCFDQEPPLYDLGGGHQARCFLLEEEAQGAPSPPASAEATT